MIFASFVDKETQDNDKILPDGDLPVIDPTFNFWLGANVNQLTCTSPRTKIKLQHRNNSALFGSVTVIVRRKTLLKKRNNITVMLWAVSCYEPGTWNKLAYKPF